jgi:hypothetical protein
LAPHQRVDVRKVAPARKPGAGRQPQGEEGLAFQTSAGDGFRSKGCGIAIGQIARTRSGVSAAAR